MNQIVEESLTASSRASLLIEALPYIQKFAGKTVVIKYGGNAIAGANDDEAVNSFAKDIALLSAVGIKPVVVHGGGPQISAMMNRLGKTPIFERGLRVTDKETIEIVSMVLLGTVNPQIVSAINMHGAQGVGISGHDAKLFDVVARDPELGFVGDIVDVNAKIVEQLLADSRVPVVATLGTDKQGNAYNINADSAASCLASALKAEKLIYLTDVVGLCLDKADHASLIHRATTADLTKMLHSGAIDGGMIPKVESCLQALAGGVNSVHILDGRIAHVVLLELFTDSGVGTMIGRG